MRELFATELRSTIASNADAWPFVDAWSQRHVGDSDGPVVTVVEAESGAAVCTIEQIDDADPGLRWRTEVAVGAPAEPAVVTVRVRLGATEGSSVAPVSYEFRTPAIVRTLLRELEFVDGSVRCLADAAEEVGASGVDHLVGLLVGDRRLPIVVVSRDRATGATHLPAGELVRELAGIAHVRVLASTQAGWTLTHAIGPELAVWDGAVRVYFPGFNVGDDYRLHRVTHPDRVDGGTVGRLRTWLGTLSAATTREHPAYEALRRDRHRRMQEALDAADPAELRDYIKLLEDDNDQERAATIDERQRNAALDRELAATRQELEQVKNNFAEITLSLRSTPQGSDPDTPIGSVIEAMTAVEELANSRFYASRVRVTPAAIESGRKFKEYANPDEMLRAVHTVMEAGALVHDRKLGTTPMEFFNRRGFGYAAQPTPHLKVDENTSHDQCLRIYWSVDEASGTWTIESIGEHA